MCTINKYDYLTGDVLASYDSIKEASIDNHIGYHTIYKELGLKRLEYPRRDFYFGYSPKPRYVVRCYDNETLQLLGEYRNIKQASYFTGVDFRVIQWNVDRDLPLNERRCGCTGLFFKRDVIDD
nr:MAG TPA: hypothetical protein [Caudoviricetes sp.]